jgi:hypothetical protein
VKTSHEEITDPTERRRVRVRVRVRKRSHKHRRRGVIRRVAVGLLIVLGILLVLGMVALIPSLEAGTQLRAARTSMQEARGALLDGDALAAEQAFADANTQLLRARSQVRNPLVRFFGFLPVIGRSPDATSALVEAGIRVSEAGMILADALKDLPGGAAALAPRNGRIPLAPLRQLAGPLAEADRLMDEAGSKLAAAPESFVVPPVAEGLAEFEPLLEEGRGAVGASAALTRSLPAFLGEEEPRLYFVGAQNPAELRGTGGLLGSYSILRVNDGKLKFGPFTSLSQLDVVSVERVEPPNPDFAARYDQYSSRGYWSNINMTPDFPSAAVAIERLYLETEGVELDGVIAVDPFALASLLEVLGPVQVPQTNTAVTATNVVEYLTNGAYSELGQNSRKTVLGEVAEKVLRRFIRGDVTQDRPARPDREPRSGAGASGGGGRDISGSPAAPADRFVAGGRALIEAAAGGHILFHAADPTVHQAFREAEIDGRLGASSGDFVSVVANNAAGNKVDFYLESALTYRVTLGPDGAAAGLTTVRFKNTAPTAGQPRYVIGPHPETDLEAGDANLLVSTYCASGCLLDRFERDGEPDQVGSQTELDHPVYSTAVHIPSGQTQKLLYGWAVSSAWEGSGGQGIYRLTYDGQATVNPPEVRMEIRVPDGYRVTSVTPGMQVLGDRVVWDGATEDRAVLEVEFQRPFLGRIWHSILEFFNQPLIRLDSGVG